MRNHHFTIVSGTYTDEQDLVHQLNAFMTTTISGWQLLDTLADDASDVHYVYRNQGSRKGYDLGYFRVQGVADNVIYSSLSFYNTTTSGSSDTLSSSETEVLASVPGSYYFIGNNDAVYVSHTLTGSGTYLSGLGFWESYYTPAYDPKSYYIFGQSAENLDFTSERVFSYQSASFGISANIDNFATFSGVGNYYTAEQITMSGVQSRTGQFYLLEPVFGYESTATTENEMEIRGEMPGLYQAGVAHSSYTHGSIILVSGIGDIKGNYFIHKTSPDHYWLLGKITREL